MATGGTIPTNRTQSVTFYNTTGIIEREKGIYLSPRFKRRNTDVGKEVRAVFLSILNTEAVTDLNYTDIAIGSWSPEDRTLVVKGNIDDFRLVTEEGDCLNYLVVTRTVTKNSVDKTFYYGFFITAVEQAGGSSIRLTVEPDDFTNVFYLHNKHVLTSDEINSTDYEPFNERMKNCYVNRQHYDRLSMDKYYELYMEFIRVTSDIPFVEGTSVTLQLEGAQDSIVGTVKSFDYDSDLQELQLIIYTDEKITISAGQNWSYILYDGQSYQCDYDNRETEWETIRNYSPTNIKIFLNQEESYKFKYQYKDSKFPLCKINNVNFTQAEMYTINNTSSFELISSSLQNKIIKTCISYAVIQTKSHEGIGPTWMRYDSQSSYAKFNNNVGNRVGGVVTPSFFLASPILVIPKEFEKFSNVLKDKVSFYPNISSDESHWQKSSYTFDNILYAINRNSMADYVYSCYLASDIGIRDNDIEIVHSNSVYKVYIKTKLVYADSGSSNDGLYLSTFWTDMSYEADVTKGLHVTDEHGAPVIVTLEGVSLVIAFQWSSMKEINLTLTDSHPYGLNIKSNYYDPVLEAEPYSFYSLSIYGSEMVLNKNRYYVESYISNVKIEYSITFNGGMKMLYVPKYTVENYETRYFNEGITMTVTSQFPLLSDSYKTYYYQNMSQMKNQFAVNDYNKGTDLLQHFLISGPNKVGNQAFKRGGWGAIAETVYQFGEMADELVDWGQSTKNIEMNQKAKLADMGRKPDNLKQAGSDVYADLESKEFIPFLNHYRIDELSYNSIAKYLERYGYQVSLYTSLNVNDRVGWNFVKLISFDWNPAYDIMVGQEENLRKIFSEGVTLLHDKNYLTSGHNYETILDE